MDKLKPCPFCGGAVAMDWDSVKVSLGHEFQAPCIECACGIQFDFKFDHPMDSNCSCCNDVGGELAKLWNARTNESQWISVADVELELHANYWVKTIDGSVLRELALYDGSSFTNGRWPVAISLISEVIKLTPPAAE